MKKSPDAFRTISEVADDLDLPQHVLRFWETRFSQIKPLKRGGGRRYYRPDDVHLLRGIKHLLYGEGYTIKGVQRILREQGVRHVMALWRDEVSEPETAGEAAPRGHEAYAPKADRPKGLEPLFEPGDEGPEAYARGGSLTARRPNFEPVLEEAQEEEEDGEEVEDEDLEEAEAEYEEEDEDSDEEESGEDEEEADEDDAETDEDDDSDGDDEEEAEDEDDEAEYEPAGLSAENRRKLEQTLRELTQLRRVLDGAS